MRISVVSSSLKADSRSRVLATICQTALEDKGISVDFIDLRQLDPPNFDDDQIYSSEAYQSCHGIIAVADAIILASPVYNWACCAELKKFVEYIGSTPPDGSFKGAFYDKNSDVRQCRWVAAQLYGVCIAGNIPHAGFQMHH